MFEPSAWRQAVYYLLLFFLLLLLVPKAGFGGDVDFWIDWATYNLEHGLGNAYQNQANNYNPLYHWVLWSYGKLMGTPERIRFFAHFLKSFTLLFDFAGAIWAASLVAQRHRRFELSLLLLFNIAFVYNTIIWEQVDAIYTLFAFGAVVLAATRRPVLSAVLLALAISAKTQAIIFIPPLLLLWGPLWLQKPWSLVQSVLAMSLTLLIVVSPFVWGGWQNDLPRILEINAYAAATSSPVSVNAYNVWALLKPGLGGYPLMEVNDALPFGGLTYKQWGMLMFMGAALLTLLPLFITTIRRVLSRWRGAAVAPPSLEMVLLTAALLPIIFTFFKTGMHERYWHPCILFLGAYGFLTRRYLLLVLASLGYFLNLEGVMHYVGLKNYSVLIFNPMFVAGLFGLVILIGLVQLYFPRLGGRSAAADRSPLRAETPDELAYAGAPQPRPAG